MSHLALFSNPVFFAMRKHFNSTRYGTTASLNLLTQNQMTCGSSLRTFSDWLFRKSFRFGLQNHPCFFIGMESDVLLLGKEAILCFHGFYPG
jgi:hypothetical protein